MITIMKIMVMRRIIRWVIRKKKLILIKTKVMLKAIWQTSKMLTNFKLKITTMKNIDKILNYNNIKIHNLIYNNKTNKTQISILTNNNLINNRISTHTHKINTTRISKILMTPTNKPNNQLIVTIWIKIQSTRQHSQLKILIFLIHFKLNNKSKVWINFKVFRRNNNPNLIVYLNNNIKTTKTLKFQIYKILKIFNNQYHNKHFHNNKFLNNKL